MLELRLLTDEELEEILAKEPIDFEDLMLLEHHIFEIGKIQDEYGENLDYDVDENLRNDLQKIINKLSAYLNSRGIHNFSDKGIDNDDEA